MGSYKMGINICATDWFTEHVLHAKSAAAALAH
jgi:hypothetical protein